MSNQGADSMKQHARQTVQALLKQVLLYMYLQLVLQRNKTYKNHLCAERYKKAATTHLVWVCLVSEKVTVACFDFI